MAVFTEIIIWPFYFLAAYLAKSAITFVFWRGLLVLFLLIFLECAIDCGIIGGSPAGRAVLYFRIIPGRLKRSLTATPFTLAGPVNHFQGVKVAPPLFLRPISV